MRRDSRAISSALTADRSDLIRGAVYLLLVLLCSMLASTRVHASLLASADYNHDAIDRQVDIRDISYHAHWLRLLRSQAEQASEDDEPYLANRIWEQLAQAGDRDAAYRLGLFYDVAVGDERDAQRAVYWYRRAAVAGEIHAQHNLGVAYAKGDGVSMDINEAIKWWTQAARRGNADSQYNLGILYAVGEYGIKPDIERAKHWWHSAAMHGDAMAQYNLGTLYVNDGAHDYCEATRWWKEAAKNGVEQANLALRVIKTRDDYHVCR